MSTTTDTERAKYDKIWLKPEYRQACHSLILWEERRDLFPAEFSSALDIGCGLGLLLPIWNALGIDAWGVDISQNCTCHPKFYLACLWEMSLGRTFDFGICTDVMEHIPEHKVTETLLRIYAHCDEILFKIAHKPDQLGGGTLHLTLKHAPWWQKQMRQIGGSSEFLGTMPRSGQLDSLIRWKT